MDQFQSVRSLVWVSVPLASFVGSGLLHAGLDVRVEAFLDRTPTHSLLSTSESAGSHEEEATETEERMASPSKQQKLESLPHFQPLTCVRVLCRERPSILGIAHVVAALDAFLDWSPRCTVAKACALCSPRLLYRVLAREAQEPIGSVKRHVQFRGWQFKRGMITAATSGNLELVHALVTNFRRFGVSLEVVKAAASHGRLEILKWLHVNRPGVASAYHTGVDLALGGGHFKVAKWLQTRMPLFYGTEVARTKMEAELDILRWAQIAAERGRLDMVKWAYGPVTGTQYESEYVVAAAVDGGHLDILMWLFENICGDRPCFFVSLSRAAYCGHLNVIEWMLRNHRVVCGPLGWLAVIEAARNGRLDILRLLHQYQVDGGPSKAMDFATSEDHLDTIKWLHANNDSGRTYSPMDSASAGGFLDVVQWLHENLSEGCSRDAMDWAAGRGHMEVVQWLAANRTEGCSSKAMDDAAGNGHLDIVKWLHINRTEGCTVHAMDAAAINGHLEVVQWLHVNRTEGCTVHAMDQAAENGHLEVVKWLHMNRTQGCTVNAMNWAAWRGHLEMVQWLHVHRTEGCTVNAMNWAAWRGHLEVVKWLHANRTEGCTAYAISGANQSDKIDVALFLHREREECDLVSAVRNDSWNRWGFVDWVYCHYPPDLASAMVANLGAERW